VQRLNRLSVLTIFLVLSACGGGGGDDAIVPAPTSTLSGNFYDSAVSGLEYYVGGISGITDSDGGFEYPENADEIVFKIGLIEIGRGVPRSIMTVLDFDNYFWGPDIDKNGETSNILVLLQSLDMDRDPSNGIEISEQARTAAQRLGDFSALIGSLPIDFANFSLVTEFVTEATGSEVLVEASLARAHFSRTLEELEDRYGYIPPQDADRPQQGDSLYVVSGSGNFASISIVDASTGRTTQTVGVSSYFYGIQEIEFVNGQLYGIGYNTRDLVKIDLNSGSVELVGNMGEPLIDRLASHNGKLYGFSTFLSIKAYEIDLDTGFATKLAHLDDMPGGPGVAIDLNGDLYAIGSDSGSQILYRLDIRTGQVLGQVLINTDVPINDMAFLKGELIAMTQSGSLMKIDPASGSVERYAAISGGTSIIRGFTSH
jgi:glutamine cyclotransferase